MQAERGRRMVRDFSKKEELSSHAQRAWEKEREGVTHTETHGLFPKKISIHS